MLIAFLIARSIGKIAAEICNDIITMSASLQRGFTSYPH